MEHPDAASLAALPPLDAGAPLPDDVLLSFERRGHALLSGLLSAEEVSQLGPGLLAAHAARRLDALRTGVRCALGDAALRDDFGVPYDDAAELEGLLRDAGAQVPFVQTFNLWRAGCAASRRLACSPRLVGAAAALLGVAPRHVRLYQDALFEKRPGDSATRWHADLAMAPLDTNASLTLWLPLQPVAAREHGGTGLDYASGSHRDLALHYWRQPTDELDGRYRIESHGALALGDVCAHHGWALHAAPPMEERSSGSDGHGGGDGGAPPPRYAFTVSYFVDGAALLRDPLGRGGPGGRDGFDEDSDSYAGWVAALLRQQRRGGERPPVAHEAVPLALAVQPR